MKSFEPLPPEPAFTGRDAIGIASIFLAITWWGVDATAGLWPVLVLLAGWLAEMMGKTRPSFDLRTANPLLAPLLVFWGTAAVGLWATYATASDLGGFTSPAGWDKFCLITGSILVFLALGRRGHLRAIQASTAAFGMLSTLVALYFLFSADFSGETVKFELIYRLGLLVSQVLPHIPLPALHPNLAGGLIAMFLPALLETIRTGWHGKPGRRKMLLLAALAAALGVSLLGLTLSMSRGAWIALAVALLAWGGISGVRVLLRKYGASGRLQKRAAAALLLAGGGAALLAIFLFGAQMMALFPSLGGGPGYITRPELQKSALFLLRDTPFTGIGLGTFPMTFSIYTLQIYVPFIVNAHQIFLDIAISQGIPGLVSWAVFLIGILWMAWKVNARGDGRLRLPLGAALAMLCVMLVHGLVEDPYYDSRAVILWLVPAGLICAQYRWGESGSAQPAGSQLGRVMGVVTGAGVLVLAAGVLLVPAWQASRLAGLGVIHQAQAELSLYDPEHFDNPTLDAVRRGANLEQAQAYFRQALAVDPNQLTALQHLAEIALSRKEYAQALQWTQQAMAVQPEDPVTRILYGDALVANGEPEAGARQVKGLIFSDGHFSGQGWYRYHLDGDTQREEWAKQAHTFLQLTQ